MSLYETVYIARQDIAAPQVEALTEIFKSIITDQGGSVEKVESWGLRTLAYRVKKNRKGHYVLMNLDAPAAAISEMERQMRIHEDVLRYLTIRVDEHETEPSVMMRNQSSDDSPRRKSYDNGPSRDERPAQQTEQTDERPVQKTEETSEQGAEA